MIKQSDIECKIDGCENKCHAKGFCRSHYRILTGENQRRWQKVKNDPSLLEKVKQAQKVYFSTPVGKKAKKIADHKYYSVHRPEILLYKKGWTEHNRFDGKKEEVLKRDKFKCRVKGCKNDDLVVHHLDESGRGKPIHNNDITNLITLCRSHHMKAHFWSK